MLTVNYLEMSASVMWKHFNDIMQMGIEKFVPKDQVTVRKRNHCG